MKKIITIIPLLLIMLLTNCFNPLSSENQDSQKNPTVRFVNPDGWSAMVGVGRIAGNEFAAQYEFTDGVGLNTSGQIPITAGVHDFYYQIRYTTSGWSGWRPLTGTSNFALGKQYKVTFHYQNLGSGWVDIAEE